MAIICPTVTATDPHMYREQLEKVAAFAPRIHLDFMDGQFAPSLSTPVENAWWPENVIIDIHLMYAKPAEHLRKLLKLQPSLVILHAEAEGHYVELAKRLHAGGIRAGIALLADTKTDVIKPGLAHIDHVLVFSGQLGYFGGQTDLKLLDKVKTLRKYKKELEIGWDGGINAENAPKLIEAGVDVLNVGGFIQQATEPARAYATLEALAIKQR